MQTRKNDYLISPVERIEGSKLPSRRQALGHFLYLHQNQRKSVREASSALIDRVQEMWKMAGIPTRHKQDAIKKIEELFAGWQGLKKSALRKTEHQVTNEGNFLETMDELFDIAHANALNLITIQEDKDFLLAQREKGRRGTMSVLDKTLQAKRARVEDRTQARKRQQEKEEKEIAEMQKSVVLESSSSSASKATSSSDLDTDAAGPSAVTHSKRGRKQVVSPELAAALDRSKLSDRVAMTVVTETARSLNQDISELALNRSTIRSQRRKFRETKAKDIRETFHPHSPLTVHWDGKLMESLTGNEKVDRLPVLISYTGGVQLLGVPSLPNGTGTAQAQAVIEALDNWNLRHLVRAFCFDTTSANTGRIRGACVLIEQMLGRDLLHFACRHHIMELLAAAAFEVCLGPSSGPDVRLFKRFQAQWTTINQNEWKDAFSDEATATQLQDGSHHAVVTLLQQHHLHQPRDDYRELIELVLTYLGAHGGWTFRSPGAISHARWMAKAIYSMKMFIFRQQFLLTSREEQGVRAFCVFVATVYVQAWYEAPQAWKAPLNDFNLLKSLCKYPHLGIRDVTTKTFNRHLWYLSEDLAALAIFDERVGDGTKQRMVANLRSAYGEDKPLKRAPMDLAILETKELSHFTTKGSMRLFRDLGLPETFLESPPSTWSTLPDYQNAVTIIHNLAVVNDHAERGVALIQEFSGKLTADEGQLQCALQVVAEHRKKFPDSKKSTLNHYNE
jgi:hypothetical protein